MKTKTKSQSWQTGFSGWIILLVVPIVFLLGTVFYFYRPTGNQPQLITSKFVVPTPTPSPWKTYSNNQFGVEITYPAQGVIWDASGMHAGDCGNMIHPDTNNPKTSLVVDNFYTLKVIPWSKTIADYMVSQGAARVYDTHPLTVIGADEGLALDNLAKGVEYARGYPPLVYVKALYKKGNNLYVMRGMQAPRNPGGCIDPGNVAPGQYPNVPTLKWDMTSSLKFTS